MPDIRRFLAAAGLLLALGSRGAFAAEKLRIVATLPNLGSIASAVGSDRVEVTTIAVGSQDAHFVDPKPSYMVKLKNADLMLVNGLDLEIGWVPPLVQGARNARILPGAPGYIDCSTGIPVLEIPSSLSRAEGDVHPYGNPHYLGDPLNAEIVAGTIAAAMKKAHPAGAEAYEAGRKAFVKQLHESLFGRDLVDLAGGAKLSREAMAGTLDDFLARTSVGGAPLGSRVGGWLAKARPLRDLPVVTYHKDGAYFARRFGLQVIDYVEPKPGIPPSARHLEELTGRLKGGEARLIITRPYVEHRSTDALTLRTGVPAITIPLEVGGDPAATDYFRLFDRVIDQLVAGLAGASGPASR